MKSFVAASAPRGIVPPVNALAFGAAIVAYRDASAWLTARIFGDRASCG
jgi:hypothetical protein